MPAKLLFDISKIDLNQVAYDQEAIRECNPQRGDMEHLNGIIWVSGSEGELLGYKDIRADEFWVSGHIPGRPLFPGVLMIECGAQLASFYTRKFAGWKGFIGFGGVEECKFRQPVTPGCRFYVLGKKQSERHGRMTCAIQGVVNGALVFEALITGVQF